MQRQLLNRVWFAAFAHRAARPHARIGTFAQWFEQGF